MRTLALVSLIALLACNAQSPRVEDISQEEFLSNPPDALILDVRTAHEYDLGHVPNAVNIPHDELASRLHELESGTDRPVLVYCERGTRASAAASILLDAGYPRVLHLDGDMSEWRANDRPIEKP